MTEQGRRMSEKYEDELDKASKAVWSIVSWCHAYPLDIFPEPDLEKARVTLVEAGITLDACQASAMRHVVKGVESLAAAAYEALEKAEAAACACEWRDGEVIVICASHLTYFERMQEEGG